MYHLHHKGDDLCLERVEEGKWLQVGAQGVLRLDRKTFAPRVDAQAAPTAPSAQSLTFDSLIGIFRSLRSYLVSSLRLPIVLRLRLVGFP
jgi:hypothetical protein